MPFATIARTVEDSDKTEPDLGALEETLGYTFNDRTLLERALTHRSWAHEHVAPGEDVEARRLHNEALEFVGDSVLGLAVADYLYQSTLDATEGDLSRMKHRLVSTMMLARVARRLGLGDHLRIGRGEEKTGGRRKRALLADVVEAVIAAVYLDGGYGRASEFVHQLLSSELMEANPEQAAAADYKTMLQERVQATFHVTPTYKVVNTEGPPHRRMFHVEVVYSDNAVPGEGSTIKAAEMDAARRALEQLNPAPQEAQTRPAEAQPAETMRAEARPEVQPSEAKRTAKAAD
ncbi:MAG TPA: ribonuclease III [Pyrinomonadaceae bacterium]|nr:ribonuclease III [Pyrinomonadaceae bacterium]